ncbi:uncharacterized protein METZ01_LOCUS57994 [marine metagenome]|jgi:hypothetical protein|uniref:Uncharacterized protein n=1 Tax=marine metagenome TaxID=408172 RepID=A0A381SM71_9ZZZZ|tara:strand:- start:449 stop:556 length:108 start_codon:yes stop_codon:yes gene_type:complete
MAAFESRNDKTLILAGIGIEMLTAGLALNLSSTKR